MTRHGKIARLPRALRETLNARIENGEPATKLVAWLNGEPKARQVLREHFNGMPISEQNLSQWKNGGFREWEARQGALAQARELAADAQDVGEATGGRLSDHLATMVASRYATALAGWNGRPGAKFQRVLRTLRILCHDITELRRGDHNCVRMAMEQERLERGRPAPPEPPRNPEETERLVRQILGIGPEYAPTPAPAPPAEKPAETPAESNAGNPPPAGESH